MGKDAKGGKGKGKQAGGSEDGGAKGKGKGGKAADGLGTCTYVKGFYLQIVFFFSRFSFLKNVCCFEYKV